MSTARSQRGSDTLARTLRVIALCFGGLALGVGLAAMAVTRGLFRPNGGEQPTSLKEATTATDSNGAPAAPIGPTEAHPSQKSLTMPVMPDLGRYPDGVRLLLLKELYYPSRRQTVVAKTEVEALSNDIATHLTNHPDDIAKTLAGAKAAITSGRLFEAEIVVVAAGMVRLPEAVHQLIQFGTEGAATLKVIAVRALAQADPSRPGASNVGLLPRGLVNLGAPIREQDLLASVLGWYFDSADSEFEVRVEVLWATSGNLEDARVARAVIASLNRVAYPQERDVARVLSYRAGTAAIPTAGDLTEALRASLGRSGEADGMLRIELRDAIFQATGKPPSVVRILDQGTTTERISLLNAITLSAGLRPLADVPWVREVAERLSEDESRMVRGAAIPVLATVWSETGWTDDPLRDRLVRNLSDPALDMGAHSKAAIQLARATIGGRGSRVLREHIGKLFSQSDFPAEAREDLLGALKQIQTSDDTYAKWLASISNPGAMSSPVEEGR